MDLQRLPAPLSSLLKDPPEKLAAQEQALVSQKDRPTVSRSVCRTEDPGRGLQGWIKANLSSVKVLAERQGAKRAEWDCPFKKEETALEGEAGGEEGPGAETGSSPDRRGFSCCGCKELSLRGDSLGRFDFSPVDSKGFNLGFGEFVNLDSVWQSQSYCF